MTDIEAVADGGFWIEPPGRFRITDAVRVPTRALSLSFDDAAIQTRLRPAGEPIPLRVRTSRKRGHESVAFVTMGRCGAVGSASFHDHAVTVRVERHFESGWIAVGHSSTGRLTTLSEGARRRLAEALRRGVAADAERIDRVLGLLAAALPILAADPARFPDAAARDLSTISAVPIAGALPDHGPKLRSRIFVYGSVGQEIWRVMRQALHGVPVTRDTEVLLDPERATSAHERMRAAAALRDLLAEVTDLTVALCPQLRRAAGFD